MRVTRIGTFNVLAVALAVAAVVVLDAHTDGLGVMIQAALSGQDPTPAIQLLAGDWSFPSMMLNMAAAVAFLALFVGGLPIAFVGIGIDRAARRRGDGYFSHPGYYSCFVFQFMSIVISAVWLTPVLLIIGWHGLIDSAGVFATYFGVQLIAGVCALPSWSRLCDQRGTRVLFLERA